MVSFIIYRISSRIYECVAPRMCNELSWNEITTKHWTIAIPILLRISHYLLFEIKIVNKYILFCLFVSSSHFSHWRPSPTHRTNCWAFVKPCRQTCISHCVLPNQTIEQGECSRLCCFLDCRPKTDTIHQLYQFISAWRTTKTAIQQLQQLHR